MICIGDARPKSGLFEAVDLTTPPSRQKKPEEPVDMEETDAGRLCTFQIYLSVNVVNHPGIII